MGPGRIGRTPWSPQVVFGEHPPPGGFRAANTTTVCLSLRAYFLVDFFADFLLAFFAGFFLAFFAGAFLVATWNPPLLTGGLRSGPR